MNTKLNLMALMILALSVGFFVLSVRQTELISTSEATQGVVSDFYDNWNACDLDTVVCGDEVKKKSNLE